MQRKRCRMFTRQRFGTRWQPDPQGRVASPFLCQLWLSNKPPPDGGTAHAKAISYGLLCHAITSPAAGTLLTAFGEPEQEYDGQDQQNGDPCKGAGCH